MSEKPKEGVKELKKYEPRTPFGRRIWELRQRIAESGQPMLDWDGVSREVAERRGLRGESES